MRQLSKASGGKPVRMFLDRGTELMNIGNRPSGFAKIKVGGEEGRHDHGLAIASWSTGGIGRRRNAPDSVRVHRDSQQADQPYRGRRECGPSRAWRAPNHPQASYLTCSALEDLAAKLHMDPLELFKKNLRLHRRARTLTKPNSKRQRN